MIDLLLLTARLPKTVYYSHKPIGAKIHGSQQIYDQTKPRTICFRFSDR